MSTPALNLGNFNNIRAADPGLIDFMRTLRDGVAVVDSSQNVIFFNDAYLKLFDLSADDIRVGDSLVAATRLLVERGMIGSEPGESIDETVARRIKSWGSDDTRVERRYLPNGRILDIYRTSTIDDTMISIHADVTEAVRNAEEVERHRQYMEVLLDNTSDGVALLDSDGRFVIFNERMLELYDIDPDSVHWGMPYREFARNFGDLKHLNEREQTAEIEKRYKFAFDSEIISVNRSLKDGRTIHVSKRNLTGGGCVMTYRDMTAQLAREHELITARRAAEESSRHKSEFVARMSHEMRTPLNGILGVAALMGRTEVDQRQEDLLNVISTSGQVLLRLIDDILDLSRIDADTFEMVEDQFDVVELVHECVGIIEPAAHDKNLRVHLTIPDLSDPLPPLIGDTVRIKQILLNLLTNAVKFTEEGTVGLRLECMPEEGNEITAVFVVSDTGVGIAKDKLEQIFNSFYQIDGTITRKYGGAGLGLAISQKLVDAMGGTIQVRSEPGQGTTLRISLTLPIANRSRRAN